MYISAPVACGRFQCGSTHFKKIITMPTTSLSSALNNFFWAMVNEAADCDEEAVTLRKAHYFWHTASDERRTTLSGFGNDNFEEVESELDGLISTLGEDILVEQLTHLA